MGDKLLDESSLILETDNVSFESSVIIESENEDGSPRKISGWFGPLSKPNGNLHLYTEEVFASAVNEASDKISKGQIIGAIRHPEVGIFSQTSPDPKEWAVKWTSLNVSEDSVFYEGEVMETPAGRLLLDIADSGVSWLVSPRGVGKKIWVEPEETSDSEADNEGYYMVSDYKIHAIDFTLDPAFKEQECVMESMSRYEDEVNEEPDEEVAVEEESEAEEVEEDNTAEDEPEVEEPEEETPADEDPSGEDEEDIEPEEDEEVDTDPIDTETNDSVDEVEEMEESIAMSQFDDRTMSILRGSALSDFATGVVDGWISEGEVKSDLRHQAIEMIKTDAESIEDAEYNATKVLPLMRKFSEMEVPQGQGVVNPIQETIAGLPNSIDDVISESVAKMPEGIKRVAWQKMLEHNYKSHPKNETVLRRHTKSGRQAMMDATYSNVDLVYYDFVLPIIERTWIELKGADLVATFPVTSPQGFIPRLFYTAEGDSSYLEDSIYQYFAHTEGNTKREAKLEMTSQNYSVGERAVAFEWSDNLAYDLQQLHGRDAESLLVNATARRLSNEIEMDIIDQMVLAATASTSTLSFGTQPPTGTLMDTWLVRGFQAHLTALETMVYEASFTHPNFLLCGQNAYEVLMMSGDMITADRRIEDERATYGLNYAGLFQGRFDIYYTTYMPNDQMVMGHAPRELSTSGVVFLPYVLGIMTDRAVNPKTNTMERAIHSRYDIQRLNDEVYGLMNVWNSTGSWPF